MQCSACFVADIKRNTPQLLSMEGALGIREDRGVILEKTLLCTNDTGEID